MIASEGSPWAKTGGLADVVGALPDAVERLGHRVTLVLPKYRGIAAQAPTPLPHTVWLGGVGHPIHYHVIDETPRRRVVFVDAPDLFDREGLYGSAAGDYPDNALRFGVLTVAALDLAERDSDALPVDVIHGHDWQAALALSWLRADPARWPKTSRAGLVLTIHNLAYQGLFDRDVIPALGLPWSVFGIDRGEFWGRFSFLKAGITAADFVTTVSPRYAKETLTPAFGSGFEGILASRGDRYVGILNGIDTTVWDPKTDPFLPAHFDVDDLSGKSTCKRALLQRFGLPVGDNAMARPIIGVVSRLVEQKGIDLIVAAGESLFGLNATWVFLGKGEPRFERALRSLADRYPSRVGVLIGFDEAAAHLVEAGSDMFLMPSTFEPCGLNQMYSLRYGTIPVVHAVGGLDDTIRHYTGRARHPNGFKFREATPEALTRVVRQALRVFQDRAAWDTLMREAMTEDHSWRTSALEYVKVYRRARADAAAR